MRHLFIVILVIVGIYTEAQLVGAKHALWEIRSALQGNSRIVILQKGREKRSATTPIGNEEAETYKGAAIHRTTIAFCIGGTLHAPPCAADDVGYVDDQTRVHFSGHPTDAEICDVIPALRATGFAQGPLRAEMLDDD
jgi:hypothetical protein